MAGQQSLLSDLSKRVKRFGKTTNKVPGTYMSAAGIQTEIHPTTLAKLAVHEAKYRRQVYVYRQHLQNTVYKIRRDQRVLRKIKDEYKQVLKYNQSHRFIHSPITSSADHSHEYIYSSLIKTLNSLSEGESNSTKGLNNAQKNNVRLILPPIEATLLEKPELEFGTDSNGLDESKETINGIEPTMEGAIGDNSESVSVSILKSNENQAVDTIQNSNKVTKSALDKKDINPKLKHQKIHDVGTNVGKINISINKTEQENSQEKELVPVTKIKDSVNKPQAKHLQVPSDTSSFMELVRLKNRSGLTKNMKVVDRLISNSKSKKFAYLSRVKVENEPEQINDVENRVVQYDDLRRRFAYDSLPNFKSVSDKETNNSSFYSNAKTNNNTRKSNLENSSLPNFKVNDETVSSDQVTFNRSVINSKLSKQIKANKSMSDFKASSKTSELNNSDFKTFDTNNTKTKFASEDNTIIPNSERLNEMQKTTERDTKMGKFTLQNSESVNRMEKLTLPNLETRNLTGEHAASKLPEFSSTVKSKVLHSKKNDLSSSRKTVFSKSSEYNKAILSSKSSPSIGGENEKTNNSRAGDLRVGSLTSLPEKDSNKAQHPIAVSTSLKDIPTSFHPKSPEPAWDESDGIYRRMVDDKVQFLATENLEKTYLSTSDYSLNEQNSRKDNTSEKKPVKSASIPAAAQQIDNLSISARQVDRFLQEEKMKTMNYKSDVTWQQSLASIRDVHYIYGKNDYEEFARRVIKDSEEKYKPLK